MTLAEGAREVLQTLPEPALILDTAGCIGFANRAATDRFGEGVAEGAHLTKLGPDAEAAARMLAWLHRCSGSRACLPGAMDLRGADGRLTRFRGFGAVLQPAGEGARARLLLRLVDREDDRFPLLGRKLDELNAEISRRRRTQLALETAVRERDVLLGELHHRVKNNIQMLVGMLAMSRRASPSADAQEVLAEAARRLAAVGAVHQMLYLGDSLHGVPGEAFLRRIGSAVLAGLGAPHELSISAEPIEIANDAAVPLGLVLNELLVNAVKHGCPDGPVAGCIRIILRRLPGSPLVELRVEDDGPGFTVDAATRTGSSGLKLVVGLARQLNGELSVTAGPLGGTEAVLRFPQLEAEIRRNGEEFA